MSSETNGGCGYGLINLALVLLKVANGVGGGVLNLFGERP